MSVIKLYHFTLSQPSRSVRMLLKAGNIPFEDIVVNVMTGEHKKPEHLARNPMGLVPTMVEDDFVLSESGAILSYLADSRKLAQWYPTEPQSRAKVNYWLFWNQSATRLSTTKILRPVFSGVKPDPADLEKFTEALAVMEKHLSMNQQLDESLKFIADTSAPTIADLTLVTELDQLDKELFDLYDYSPFPHVSRYMTDVRNNVSSYEEIFAPVKAVADAKRK